MAVLERWFGPNNAGLGNGTSYANRAAFAPGGSLNSIITDTNFNNDVLVCRIEPEVYSFASTWNSLIWNSGPPTLLNRLYLYAANAGELNREISGNWCSAQPSYSTANMPVFDFGTSQGIATGSIVCNGIRLISAVAPTSQGVVASTTFLQNCVAENSGAGNVIFGGTGVYRNCVFRSTGATYNAIYSGASSTFQAYNCRFEGNPAAVSGQRVGILNTNTNNHQLTKCTIVRNVTGIWHNSTASVNNSRYHNLVVADNTTNMRLLSTATSVVTLTGLMVTGGTTGLEMPNLGIFERCRFRNTNNFTSGMANQHYQDILDAAGSDVDEYVDSAGGDYRIKAGSVYWGRNIGAGDQPMSGGGKRLFSHFG